MFFTHMTQVVAITFRAQHFVQAIRVFEKNKRRPLTLRNSISTCWIARFLQVGLKQY